MSSMKLSMLWALCAGLSLAGCAPYVNIPPQAGDVALDNPNLRTVQHVSVVAVQAALEDRPVTGSYTLVLPRGTTPAIYQQVLSRLGEQATTTVDARQHIIEVRQIRVRLDRAEVDVVRAADMQSPRGPGQLVTVYLRNEPFIGWMPQRTRAWLTPTDIVEPPADYATAPPPPVEAIEDAEVESAEE